MCGLVLVVALAVVRSSLEHEQLRADLAAHGLDVSWAVTSSLSGMQTTVSAATGAVSLMGANMTRLEFSVLSQHGIRELDFVQAFSFIAVARGDEQRRSLEQRARESIPELVAKGINPDIVSNYATISFTDTGGNVREYGLDVYFPVYYIEPLEGNSAALLLDLGSSAARRAAINALLDSGNCTTTAPITLVQESATQYGVLYLCSAFAFNTDSPTEPLVTTGVAGLTSTVLRVGDLLTHALQRVAAPSTVRSCLIDETDAENPVLLHCARIGQDGSIEEITGAETQQSAESGIDAVKFFGGSDTSFPAEYFALDIPSRAWTLQVHYVADVGISTTLILLEIVAVLLVIATSVTVTLTVWGLAIDREEDRRRSAMMESLNDAKTEFLRYVFHELRVPFNAVVIALTSLGLDDSTETRDTTAGEDSTATRADRRIILGAAQSAARQTIKVLNETLDLQKMEAGKFELIFEAVNLEEIVSDVVSTFDVAAQLQGISLDLEISPGVAELPPMIADQSTISHALLNYTGNALKFVAPDRLGKVVVRVEVVDRVAAVQGKQVKGSDDTLAESDDGQGFGSDGVGSRSPPSPQRRASPGNANVRYSPLAARGEGTPDLSGRDSRRAGVRSPGGNGVVGLRSRGRHRVPPLSQMPGQLPSFVRDTSRALPSSMTRADGVFGRSPLAEKGATLVVDSGPVTPEGQFMPEEDVVAGCACRPSRTRKESITTADIESPPDDIAVTWVRFSVIDNGIGIPQAALSQLFRPFQQVTGEKAKLGTGLGLNIARHRITQHGGRLGVRSAEGVGSCFWFELPLAPVPDDDRLPEIDASGDVVPPDRASTDGRPRIDIAKISDAAWAACFQGLHILAVDDDTTTRKMMGFLFKRLGARFHCISDGDQLVRIYERQLGRHSSLEVPATPGCVDPERFDASTVDVILLDRTMMRVDGLEAASALRRMGITTPIIALTGDALDSEREEFLRAGASVLIAKPFTQADIKKALLQLANNGLLAGGFSEDGSRFVPLPVGAGRHIALPADSGGVVVSDSSSPVHTGSATV